MSDFEEKLNHLLSDQQSMGKILQLAQELNLDPPSEEETGAAAEAAPPDLSALLEQLDPGLLQNIAPLMEQLHSPRSRQREQLLRSMRPFLSPQRQENIDRALQLSRLLTLGKTYFLKKQGDGDV